jgi:hypothetical protein
MGEGKTVTKTILEKECTFSGKLLKKIGLKPLKSDRERYDTALDTLMEKGLVIERDEKIKVGSTFGIPRKENVLKLDLEKVSENKDLLLKKEKILK